MIMFDPLKDIHSFILIPLLEVYHECNVLYGGTWRTFRVPDQRLGGQKTKDIPKRSSEYSRVTPEIF